MSRLTLALDVMGGDVGPRITMPSAIQAVMDDEHLSLLLFGSQSLITPYLAEIPHALQHVRSRLIPCYTSTQILDTDNFSQAMRRSRGTSMRQALEAVCRGQAQGCVSAGNTGVLMGLAKILIKPIHHIDRPALASIIPSVRNKPQVMLDLGANIDCSAQNLYQFALMGSLWASQYFNMSQPKVALLNIGSESHKGTQTIRDAMTFIQQDPKLNYAGFIEGDQLLEGQVDVIVQDGLMGNIALKTLEGAVKHLQMLFKQSHPLFNPERYNGASLLGLQAVVVKSHGSANKPAFYHAIQHTAKQVRLGIPQKITQALSKDRLLPF